ncbi:MAG TPA: ABC transporter permease subunit [Bacilli bacterium]|nr:ABC transporter permease subunit [Bacilli bacterium]
MRFLKELLIACFLLLGILAVSNLDQGVQVYATDQTRVIVYPTTDLEHVVAKHPDVQIVDAQDDIVSYPAAKQQAINKALLGDPQVRLIENVVIPPTFQWGTYREALKKQADQYLDGDWGTILYSSAPDKPRPITEHLGEMTLRSLTYLIPGLLLGLVGGFACALIAVLKPRVGRVFDWLHSLLMGLPDFFVVVFLQFIAILLARMAGKTVFLIMQFQDHVPYLIPLLAIAVMPGTLIYGTLRLAIEREWEEGYIKTAYAKGLSRPMVIVRHMIRNTWEDLLTVIPRALAVGITAMVIAEVLCGIFALGGFGINSSIITTSAIPTTCAILAGFVLIARWLVLFSRRTIIVDTKEGA